MFGNFVTVPGTLLNVGGHGKQGSQSVSEFPEFCFSHHRSLFVHPVICLVHHRICLAIMIFDFFITRCSVYHMTHAVHHNFQTFCFRHHRFAQHHTEFALPVTKLPNYQIMKAFILFILSFAFFITALVLPMILFAPFSLP